MDKQPVGQLPDLQQSNNDDEIMVITNDEYNQLKKEKISDFITDLTSTDAANSLVKGDDGKLFVSKTINASDVDGVLSLDNIPQLSTNKLPETGISADNYSYPSSITVNDRGQVVSIVEGSAAEAGAYLDQSQITNCILEAPESIKYTLNNGVLTLKAGSVITIPDGFNTNGSKKFRYVEIENDVTGSTEANDEKRLIYYNETTGRIMSMQYSESGTTDYSGTGNCLLYRTDLNKTVVFYGGNKSEHVVSLPLMEINGDVAAVVSINSVFNTCSYIGSTIFVNKGIKVLMPDGKNPDGTLKNVEYLTPTVSIQSVEDLSSEQLHIMCTQSGARRASMAYWEYNPDINYICGTGSDNLFQKYVGTMVGEATVSDGKITSFKLYNTFHAIDYNEAVKRSGDTMYGGLTIEDSQLTVKGAYPAYYGKNTNIAISDTTAPSSSQFFLQLRGDDMNGDWVGCNQYYQTRGNAFMGQNVIRRKVNNVYEECRLDLIITNNGTRTANVLSDNITHNGTTIRYVKQTYINGASWYRVWSDGWCEQGGRGYAHDSQTHTVNFLKTFANANYTLEVQMLMLGTGGNISDNTIITAMTANSYAVAGSNVGPAGSWECTTSWYAAGQLAAGQY